jgi:hypothetical protein
MFVKEVLLVGKDDIKKLGLINSKHAKNSTEFKTYIETLL